MPRRFAENNLLGPKAWHLFCHAIRIAQAKRARYDNREICGREVPRDHGFTVLVPKTPWVCILICMYGPP
jgi:hypothetical protein